MIRIRLGLHLKPWKTISKSEDKNDLPAQDRNGLRLVRAERGFHQRGILDYSLFSRNRVVLIPSTHQFLLERPSISLAANQRF